MYLLSRDDVPPVHLLPILTPCSVHNSHESLRHEQGTKDVLVNVRMESNSLQVTLPQVQFPLFVH